MIDFLYLYLANNRGASRFPVARRWLQLIALVFLFVLFPMQESAAKKIHLGQIEKIIGDVRVAQGLNSIKPAKVGQAIYVYDLVKSYSKSRVLISMQDGTTFKLGENSKIRFKRPRVRKNKKTANVSELLEGAVWASFDPVEINVITVLETSSAGVSIRGTELMAVTHGDVSTIFLNSGKITVTGGEAQLMLAAGEMTANVGKRRLIMPVTVKGRDGLQKVQEHIMAATTLDGSAILEKRTGYREILARFYINYASYLVDIGSYYDAITVLLMAQSITAINDIKAESSILIANIQARFLNAYAEAIQHYKDILTRHPNSPYYEVTLFHYGLLLKTKGDKSAAREIFLRYQNEFPNGKYRQTVLEHFVESQ